MRSVFRQLKSATAVALLLASTLAIVLALRAGELLAAGDSRALSLSLLCAAAMSATYAIVARSGLHMSERERELAVVVGARYSSTMAISAMISATILYMAISEHSAASALFPLTTTVPVLLLLTFVSPAAREALREAQLSAQSLEARASEGGSREGAAALSRAAVAAAAAAISLILALSTIHSMCSSGGDVQDVQLKSAIVGSKSAAALLTALAIAEVVAVAALKSSLYYAIVRESLALARKLRSRKEPPLPGEEEGECEEDEDCEGDLE